jgi:hypothetical protein
MRMGMGMGESGGGVVVDLFRGGWVSFLWGGGGWLWCFWGSALLFTQNLTSVPLRCGLEQ